MNTVAAAGPLTVYPLTWNVVGLDSNNVLVGPNLFPVGARVCNTSGATINNLTAEFKWTDETNKTYIYLSSDTNPAYITGDTLANKACKDYYFEVEIARVSASYNKTRRFTIDFSADGGLTGTTPSPREIYVEKLVSQNRNGVYEIMLDGESILPGATMSLMVGKTYNITLVGSTSSIYNQLESYINISNTIFRINSVTSTYSSVSYSPTSSTLLYADSCGWDNNPLSPSYRSCVVSDGKSGGTVTVNYNVTILSDIGSTHKLESMFYDFSGSSYHYNADFSSSYRLVSIIAPLSFSKTFPAISVSADQTTALEFNLVNNGADDALNVTFTDPLPSISGSQMTVAAAPGVTYSSGCLAGSELTAVAGASSISFAGGVQAGSTCTIEVTVKVPASPTSGTYINTTTPLIIGGVDTGITASANLVVAPTTAGHQICTSQTIASWAVGTTANPPTAVVAGGITAAASAGTGITTTIDTGIGNPVNSWRAGGFEKATTLNLANLEYFQFGATTTGYSNIGFRFDARTAVNASNGKTDGPQAIALYYSNNDGASFSPYGTVITPTGAFVTNNQAFTGTANPSGQTIFRVYGYNPGNPGNSDYLYVDNIAISGTTCLTPQPPTLDKTFVPGVIAENGTSVLTFTVGNPSGIALTEGSFSDTLPAGLSVAVPAGITNTCGGTFTASGSQISLTGGAIPAAGCTIRVNVTGATAGVYTNTTGFISSYESGTNSGDTGTASSELTVVAPPNFTKNFSPNPVYANEVSTLTFTIANPNTTTLTGITLNDPLYTDAVNGNLVVADPSGAVSSGCNANAEPGFALTAVPGSNSIQMVNGSIGPNDYCTIAVRVVSSSTYDFPNSASLGTSVTGLVVPDATDTLSVIEHYPGIRMLKQVALGADGPWSNYLVTAPAAQVYYRLLVENTGDVALTNLTVSDPQLNLSSCKWPTTLPVASPAQDPTASCVVGPITALSSGSFTNNASASGDYSGTTYTSVSSATYAISDLIISKAAVQNSFADENDPLDYIYTVTNNGSAILAGPVSVYDSRISVSCADLTTIGNLDANLDPGESVTCTGSDTVTLTDLSAGSVSNSASAVVDGVTSNTAREIVYVNQPDLIISKANSTGGYGEQGTSFNWVLKTRNVGPVAADFADSQMILSDSLPLGAGYAVSGPSALTNISGTGSISCKVESMVLSCSASGGNVIIGGDTGSFTVTLAVTPSAGGNLNNTAVVDPGKFIPESNEANNTSSNGVSISSTAPSISLDKSANTATYIAAGSVISYEYIITNTGSTTLSGPFTVDDDKAVVTCPDVPVGGLAPLSTLSCTANYTITQQDMDNGHVTNLATAYGNDLTSNPDSVTIDAVQSPELLLVKLATPNTYSTVGTIINYSYELTNTGNITLNGPFSVSDDKLTVTCPDTPVSLAPGEKITCSASYNIAQSDIDNGSIVNTATGAGTGITSNADIITVTADQTPALTLVKTASPSTFATTGVTISYEYTLTNSGNVTLSAPYTVSDDKVSVTCPDMPASLLPGESVTCSASYDAQVSDLDAGSITNLATGAALFGTTPVSSNLDGQTVNAVQTPQLTLVKTAAETTYNAVGNILHFTVTASNTGNVTLTNVTVTDPQLTDLVCAPATPATLAPGQSITCTGTHMVVQADMDSGFYLNTANASANPPTGDPLTATADKQVNAEGHADLSLAKTALETSYAAVGDILHFSVTATNTGAVTLTAVTISDPQLADLACSPTQPATLEPGASLVCTGTHTVTQADLNLGYYTNHASVEATSPGGPLTRAVDDTVNATLTPDITLTKTSAETSYSAVGDVLHFTVTATNTGNVTLTAVSISDPQLTDLSCTPSQPLTLAPGASLVCTGSYTVTQADLDYSSYTNNASATANPPTGDPLTPTTFEIINADQNPALTLTKVAEETSFDAASDVLHFTVTATNTGNVTLTAVSISDPQLADLSCTPTQPLTLDPGEALVCTGTHTIDQADLDAGEYTNTANATATPPSGTPLTPTAEVTVNGTSVTRIGAAKRLVGNPLPVAGRPGVWDVTYELVVTNYGNTSLSYISVTDRLDQTFVPNPITTFEVVQVTSTDFTVNPSFNGIDQIELLGQGNSLDPAESGKLTLVVRVTPGITGPFNNSAHVSGLTPSEQTISDVSQDGLNPDPDGNNDPTDNNVPTPLIFTFTNIASPIGVKTVDAANLPNLKWTVVWINRENTVQLEALSTDEIPVGTSFVDDGVSSGYPLPAGAPAGSTANGVKCEDTSIITTTTACYYEAPTIQYPRGRVIWQGVLGEDYGATDAASADNEIAITYSVHVNTSITSVTNTAEISIDTNGDGDFIDAGEVNVASVTEDWSTTLPEEPIDIVDTLPGTGFAPGRVTLLPNPSVDQSYARYSDLTLQIPALGIKTGILGIPLDNGEWDVSWLGGSAGWLNGTAFPTWTGNSVITGHVWNANNMPGLFVNIKNLKYGDRIIIQAYGSTYTYEVRENVLIAPTNMERAFKHEEKAWVTLLTCESFNEKTASYKYRRIVRAVLVSVK